MMLYVLTLLAKDDIHKIIDIELKSLYGRINELGYQLNYLKKLKIILLIKVMMQLMVLDH